MEGKSGNAASTPTSRKVIGVKGALTINTETVPTTDCSIQSSPLASIGLGTPKFHRKPHVNPPPTPIISQAPKVSWFNQLFNFKQGTTVFKTETTFSITQQKLLQIFEVSD